MLDERRIHGIVSEGDITQLQFAQQLAFFRHPALGLTVFRIFHHILHTFHLRAHLHQLQPGVDYHRQQVLRQRGQQVHLALLNMHLALLVELARPQATPVLEEPFFGSGSLDALDVLQAADRGGIIFAFTLLCAPDHVQAAMGIVAYNAQVYHRSKDSDQRQGVIV